MCFSNEDKPEYHQTKIVFEQIQDWNFPYRTLVADVIPESVGAFTGCRLDGVEVYEGDVIVCLKMKFCTGWNIQTDMFMKK